jgi:hypothetical protein
MTGEHLFLGLVIAAFSIFGIALFGVSTWMSLKK